jgi:hypothetical protein
VHDNTMIITARERVWNDLAKKPEGIGLCQRF